MRRSLSRLLVVGGTSPADCYQIECLAASRRGAASELTEGPRPSGAPVEDAPQPGVHEREAGGGQGARHGDRREALPGGPWPRPSWPQLAKTKCWPRPNETSLGGSCGSETGSWRLLLLRRWARIAPSQLTAVLADSTVLSPCCSCCSSARLQQPVHRMQYLGAGSFLFLGH